MHHMHRFFDGIWCTSDAITAAFHLLPVVSEEQTRTHKNVYKWMNAYVYMIYIQIYWNMQICIRCHRVSALLTGEPAEETHTYGNVYK